MIRLQRAKNQQYCYYYYYYYDHEAVPRKDNLRPTAGRTVALELGAAREWDETERIGSEQNTKGSGKVFRKRCGCFCWGGDDVRVRTS